MEQQESHWQGERRETNRAFLRLLDLASIGKLIAGWTEGDYAAYREKQIATVHQLQDLKPLQEDAVQRAAIDSVCNLLVEKELLELSEPEERKICLRPATGKGANEHRYTPRQTNATASRPAALLHSLKKE